jgi:hypothetical protein
MKSTERKNSLHTSAKEENAKENVICGLCSEERGGDAPPRQRRRHIEGYTTKKDGADDQSPYAKRRVCEGA